MKHCVLGKCGYGNHGANSHNIVFTIKDTKLYVHAVTLLAKENKKNCQNYQKGLKDQCIGMNIKQKGRVTIQQMRIYIFSCYTL